MKIAALIPAHNEEDLIETTLTSLQGQTVVPDEIWVVADNCTDGTIEITESVGCKVFETKGNADKKAGALNQALSTLLPSLDDEDLVLIQDADSSLDSNFIENAKRSLLTDSMLGAIGGVFRGGPGGGFVGHLQRNEYARYARDVKRLNDKCLVVTGTAALFKVKTLRAVSQARLDGLIPVGDGNGGVYDTTVLTEDNEISFALMHLGYKILSPFDCTLETEVMTTWKDLWNQRLRWKRGAVENCIQYGLTRVTWRYWGRQILTFMGVLITFLYFGSIGWSLAMYGGVHIKPFWLAVTLVFVLERVVTVQKRGWRYMLLAATMYELVIDTFLQLVHTKAYADAILNKKKEW